MSALAIGLSGASTIILQCSIVLFDPQQQQNASQSNTGIFNDLADEFLKRIPSRPATVGGITSRHMDE